MALALAYGRAPAVEFLRFLGPLHGCVVDVGSGEGAWAPRLREAGAETLVAVEPCEPSAEAAAANGYDRVIQAPVEEVEDSVFASASLIIVADCLEHLVDPWTTLRALRRAAGPATRLAISVPNFRYVGVLGPALVRGRFDYSDAGGVMDRGHLRWFTRASLEGDLRDAGWTPLRGSVACGTGRRAQLNRLTRHRLADLVGHQLYVLAS